MQLSESLTAHNNNIHTENIDIDIGKSSEDDVKTRS
jgi:hypothetical protein